MQQRERDWSVLLYSPSHTDSDLSAICFTLTSKERFGVKEVQGGGKYLLKCVDIS